MNAAGSSLPDASAMMSAAQSWLTSTAAEPGVIFCTSVSTSEEEARNRHDAPRNLLGGEFLSGGCRESRTSSDYPTNAQKVAQGKEEPRHEYISSPFPGPKFLIWEMGIPARQSSPRAGAECGYAFRGPRRRCGRTVVTSPFPPPRLPAAINAVGAFPFTASACDARTRSRPAAPTFGAALGRRNAAGATLKQATAARHSGPAWPGRSRDANVAVAVAKPHPRHPCSLGAIR
jgi:hypothetical protein